MNTRRFISHGPRQLEVESFDLDPLPDDGLLVENEYTAVSVGTEIYGWTQGAEPGSKASYPRTTGYCNCGTVLEVGQEVTGLEKGARVACAGAGYASHAEVVFVPKNLLARVSPDVPDESACFTTLGAIAVQGIRVSEAALGDRVCVIGLGTKQLFFRLFYFCFLVIWGSEKYKCISTLFIFHPSCFF